MVHHRQRLALGLEARDDLAAVHAGFDDLQRHPPLHRRELFRDVDLAEAALADELQNFVPADDRAGVFRRWHELHGSRGVGIDGNIRRGKEVLRFGMRGGVEQGADLGEQCVVAGALGLDEGLAIGGGQREGVGDDWFDAAGVHVGLLRVIVLQPHA